MLAHTRPLVISGFGGASQACRALERIGLEDGAGVSGYNEDWLQSLIHDHPALLPVAEIEPALQSLVPVCRELPVPTGYVDNLYVTPEGGIVLVETKLWRNAESRRKVVAQILDYAKDLARMSYDDLESRIRQALRNPGFSLFRHVLPEGAPIEEARFHDAVARNLRLGRMLLLIVGDGIQESVEQLAEYLQRHIGLHFSLALVELALFRDEDRVVVQPKVVVRTVQIERAVVRLESGVAIGPASIETVPDSSTKARPVSLTDQSFDEALAMVDPKLPEQIRAFLERASLLGVIGEQKVNLNLKWVHPEKGSFSVGVINRSGQLETSVYVPSRAGAIGRHDLSETYLAALASIIPNGVVRKTASVNGWSAATADGKAPAVSDLLRRQDDWLKAIGGYADGLQAALAEPG